MPWAYSTDLKVRVLEFISAGGRKSQAAKLFKVARFTVFVWLGEGPDYVPSKPGLKDSPARTRQIARQSGCELLYLAPYSPDLNPIEKLWANLKRRWRKVCGSLEEMIKKSDY